MESNAKEYFEMIKRISPYTLDLATANTREEFEDAFDGWFEKSIADLEKNSKNLQALGEEGISAVLALALNTPDLIVKQETNSNGHVDLTIELRNPRSYFIKLGEAKLWGGKKYHVSGLDQLLNRYSTGRECRGFVISYVKEKDIAELLEKLRDYIDAEKPHELSGPCNDHNKIKWSFLSSHKHKSGEVIDVHHIGCNLYIGD